MTVDSAQHSRRQRHGVDLTCAGSVGLLERVVLGLIRPGKPTDNGIIEAVNNRFRQECLNRHCLLSVADAQEELGTWRDHYNSERPHSSIENTTPKQFAGQSVASRFPGDGQGARARQTRPIRAERLFASQVENPRCGWYKDGGKGKCAPF